MPAGVRKIPTAMHSPATTAVAEATPSSLRNWLGATAFLVFAVIFWSSGSTWYTSMLGAALVFL
jgi:putative Ca2+/H+ antiporter (TMEM165/GDT1 family)